MRVSAVILISCTFFSMYAVRDQLDALEKGIVKPKRKKIDPVVLYMSGNYSLTPFQKKHLKPFVSKIKKEDHSRYQRLQAETMRAPKKSKKEMDRLYQALLSISQELKKNNDLTESRRDIEKAMFEDEQEQGEIDEEERKFNRTCTWATQIITVVGIVISTNVVSNLINYYSSH